MASNNVTEPKEAEAAEPRSTWPWSPSPGTSRKVAGCSCARCRGGLLVVFAEHPHDGGG